MAVKPRINFNKRRSFIQKTTGLRKRVRKLNNTVGIIGDLKYYTGSGGGNCARTDAAEAGWNDEKYLLGRYFAAQKLRANYVTTLNRVGDESITDVRGSKARARGEYNFVDHSKGQIVNYPHLVINRKPGSATMIYYVDYYRRATPILTWIPFNRAKATEWMRDDLDFSHRAWLTMQPQFEGEVSLINTIWELKDFRKYAKLLLDLDKILYKGKVTPSKRDLTAAWKRAQPVYDVKKGAIDSKQRIYESKGVSKLAAELNLWWQYEVKPTLNDISEIATQLKLAAAEAQQQYIEQGITGSTRHYTEVQRASTMTPWTLNYANCWATGTSWVCKRVGEFQFTYEYEARNGLALMSKYWGLQSNMESIWNMIPGSFLLDYVSTISKTLHMLRTDKNTSATLGLYGESVKFQQSQGYHLVWHPDLLGCVINDRHVPRRKDFSHVFFAGNRYTHYIRKQKQPQTIGFVAPKLKLPSWQQGLNVVSLARCLLK